jgi:hypothetical protein
MGMSAGRIFLIHHGHPRMVSTGDWFPLIDCAACSGKQVDGIDLERDGNSLLVTVRCHRKSQAERIPMLELLTYDFEVGPAFHPELHLVRRVVPPPPRSTEEASRVLPRAIHLGSIAALDAVKEGRELGAPIGSCVHGQPFGLLCNACLDPHGGL